MKNVTTGRTIYRLLPHGEYFIEPAVLTMEYDLRFIYRRLPFLKPITMVRPKK